MTRLLYRLSLLCCCFISYLAQAQSNYTWAYVYRNVADSSVNCYLKIIPNQPIKGLVVRDFSRLPNMHQPSRFNLHGLAAEKGVMTVFTTTSKTFPELYIDQEPIAMLDSIIHEVMVTHDIPKDKVVLGGISASGTRAIQYVQYCRAGHSAFAIQPRGVFAVDSPIDFERFWYESEKAVLRNFDEAAVKEGHLVVEYFMQKLGGPPMDFNERYVAASPFIYTNVDGGKAKLLKDVAVVLITETDPEWWLEVKRKDLYDYNSIDASALANYLLLLGNEQVKLINTSGKGYLKSGARHPHSWSIVDESMLARWIDAVLAKP